jgi:hypothetical protein
MITIKNYRLEPYLAANAPDGTPSTEWLREAVNKLMRQKRDALEAAGADTSLFYNHDPATGRTRVGYPLVIYHCIDGVFFITGINKGAFALEKLAELTTDDVGFKCFRNESAGGDFELGITSRSLSYSLIEWRPIHHKSREAFMQLSMTEKVKELNNRLKKHITNELGKYLNISMEGLKLEIDDITRVYEPVSYKKHKYPAFDIRFTANVSLPPMITLGNHQALGYGRAEPL